MTTSSRARSPETVRIKFQAIRNLTSPEEKRQNVQTYFANIPVRELVTIPTGHNLRNYIAEHNPRKRNQVHRAIRKTIELEPDRFINRNSGATVCCSRIEIDEKTNTATLHDASLINGAQTQGEIKGFLEEFDQVEQEGHPDPEFHVRVEINVDPDEGSIIETAIARNTATAVKSISQAGARGILDDLQKSFKAATGRNITMSETDDDPDAVDTKLLLQLARLVLPEELRPSQSEAEILKPYKNKEKCLQEFSDWHRDKENDEKAAARYEFAVQIVGPVWKLFDMLHDHSAWNGHRLHEITDSGGRAVRRDAKKKVVWVAPGILFPMIRALSAFVHRKPSGKWAFVFPDLFVLDELISRAVKQFRASGLDPYVMGRSVAAYEALATYPETIIQLLDLVESRKKK